MNYIYLHGFASGPQSRKAQDLSDRFQQQGHKLRIPDLNQGDFSRLTLSRQIQQVEAEYLSSGEPAVIIGSSFGGLTAAWLAQRCTSVQRLILLAPAFQFLENWLPKLSDQQRLHWQRRGQMAFYHYGQKEMLLLQYEFVTDLRQYSDDDLDRAIPTLIIHGIQDDVVSIQVSRDYAHDRSWVELKEVASDHSLGDQLDTIWTEVARVCDLI